MRGHTDKPTTSETDKLTGWGDGETRPSQSWALLFSFFLFLTFGQKPNFLRAQRGSGRAALELQGRRGGVFSRPGPARTTRRPAAKRSDRFLPGSLAPQRKQGGRLRRCGRSPYPDSMTECLHRPPPPGVRARTTPRRGGSPAPRASLARPRRQQEAIGLPSCSLRHLTQFVPACSSRARGKMLGSRSRVLGPRDSSSPEGRAGWGRLLESG